jgi:hypothetical protein
LSILFQAQVSVVETALWLPKFRLTFCQKVFMVSSTSELEVATREGTGFSPLPVQARQRPVLWINCQNETIEAFGAPEVLA